MQTVKKNILLYDPSWKSSLYAQIVCRGTTLEIRIETALSIWIFLNWFFFKGNLQVKGPGFLCLFVCICSVYVALMCRMCMARPVFVPLIPGWHVFFFGMLSCFVSSYVVIGLHWASIYCVEQGSLQALPMSALFLFEYWGVFNPIWGRPAASCMRRKKWCNFQCDSELNAHKQLRYFFHL